MTNWGKPSLVKTVQHACSLVSHSNSLLPKASSRGSTTSLITISLIRTFRAGETKLSARRSLDTVPIWLSGRAKAGQFRSHDRDISLKGSNSCLTETPNSPSRPIRTRKQPFQVIKRPRTGARTNWRMSNSSLPPVPIWWIISRQSTRFPTSKSHRECMWKADKRTPPRPNSSVT